MSRTKLGEFPTSTGHVDVYADTELWGGKIYVHPECRGNPQIVVGIVAPQWGDILAIAMHETMEYHMASIGCLWGPSVDWADSTSAYLFVMSHAQFEEANARAAWLLSKIYAPLMAAHMEFHTKKPKKPKKKLATARRAK